MNAIELIAEDCVSFPAQGNTIKSEMIFPTDNRTTDKMPNGEAHILQVHFVHVFAFAMQLAALLEPYNKSGSQSSVSLPS